MQVYLGKDKRKDQPHLSASYKVVYADTIQGKGHKLYTDNFFSSPKLFCDLLEHKKNNCYGTVKVNRKDFPKELCKKKLKTGENNCMWGNGLVALCWKDKRDVLMLSNIQSPTENKVSDEKPEIVASYNEHMGYVDKSDRMANSYSFNRRTLKWTKKVLFHFLDLSVLNAYLASELKETRKEFRTNLIRDLLYQNSTTFQKFSPSTSKRPRFLVENNH